DLEVRARDPDLRVAVHARLGRRDAGRRRLLDGRVAVPAIDPKAAGVVLVTELHGLLAHLVLVRGEGRAAQSVEREEKPAREENDGDDASARIAIGTWWENLRHLSRLHGSTAGLAEECVGRPPWRGDACSDRPSGVSNCQEECQGRGCSFTQLLGW